MSQVDGIGWMPDCDCAPAYCCSECCDGTCFPDPVLITSERDRDCADPPCDGTCEE